MRGGSLFRKSNNVNYALRFPTLLERLFVVKLGWRHRASCYVFNATR